MLFIFDKDGTIIFAPPDRIPKKPAEQWLLPGVLEKTQVLLAEGHTLAVASNQGGVAMGYLTEQDAQRLVEHAARLIGAEHFAYCPFHPQGLLPMYREDAWCRKPKPGMLETLMAETGFGPDGTVFVGNAPEDEAAALAAAVGFVWAVDFF